MAELKTKVTDQSIEEFMELVDPKRKQEANPSISAARFRILSASTFENIGESSIYCLGPFLSLPTMLKNEKTFDRVSGFSRTKSEWSPPGTST